MVARYVDRCQSLHAERLRTLCASEARNAERLLTLDLSAYLIEAGISPLIDATAGERRGEGVGSATLSFYAEAKQYTTANPGIPIQRAFAQVWGTWSRLRKLYRSHEAFLVIFRRSGRLVELPSVIAFGDLKLYAVVADIAQADAVERTPPVHLSEASLRPDPQPPAPVRRARRTAFAARRLRR